MRPVPSRSSATAEVGRASHTLVALRRHPRLDGARSVRREARVRSGQASHDAGVRDVDVAPV
jgi:hypothetical protein